MEPFIPVPRALKPWAAAGVALAAVFAVWMFFFPQFIPTHFAWVVEPRLAQVFIGAGYVFRTFFFLQFLFIRNWLHIRWTFWGNMAFTGTLLLATLWHADEMNWRFLLAHLWIIFYTFEPITMIFSVPWTPEARHAHLTGGGPILPWFRRFIILVVGVLMLMGLLLVINPEWLDLRWAWDLNGFDARIIAAWFLGWAVWAGTIGFAHDWDEVRTAGALAILWGVTVCLTLFLFRSEFDFGRAPTMGYAGIAVLFTLGFAFFFWRQEARRKTSKISKDL